MVTNYNAKFLHHNWDILGADYIAAVQFFFSTGQVLKDRMPRLLLFF